MRLEPATFGDIAGMGLMVLTHGSRGLPDLRGSFMAGTAEDQGKLFEFVGVAKDYVGPVRDEQGETRRMRVRAFVQRMSPLSDGPVHLVGSGSPVPLDES